MSSACTTSGVVPLCWGLVSCTIFLAHRYEMLLVFENYSPTGTLFAKVHTCIRGIKLKEVYYFINVASGSLVSLLFMSRYPITVTSRLPTSVSGTTLAGSDGLVV